MKLHHRIRTLSLLVSLLVLAVAGNGCISASGQIDIGKLKLSSGYFTEQDPYYDGDRFPGAWGITLSSLSNVCGRTSDYNDAWWMAEDAGEMQDAWEEFYGDDFWMMMITVVTDETNESQQGQFFDGLDWDDFDLGDGEFTAQLMHVTDVPGDEYFEGGAYLDEYGDALITDGGTLRLSKHSVDKKVGGKLEAEVVWMDLDEEAGDSAGNVSVDFEVGTCPELFY